MSSPSKENSGKETTWFMINLIMHTEAGKLDKIDWDAFTQKMGITTKGAAMKRYERLLGSYGLTTSYAPKPGAQPGPPQGESSPAGPSTTAPKRKSSKRKRANPSEENDQPEDAGDKA